MIDRDDIIRMAENAGMPFNKSGLIGCERCEFDADEILERFAALVAAQEREACAKLAEDNYFSAKDLAKDIRARGNG